jgi:uncharacterized protein YegL
MKKGLTEMVFILDRSGSMSGLEKDTIGGYNSLLEKQKQEPGEAVITTVLFDDRCELLHDRINLKGVEPITGKEYFVRGSTALLDAIGRIVDKTVNAQKNTAEDEKAENVMFVITTDGLENSSREYRYDKIKAMIERQKEAGWEFLFIGANIDAVEVASKYGISADYAANYHADSRGTERMFFSLNKAMECKRRAAYSAPIGASWKEELDEDYNSRKDGSENNRADMQAQKGSILSRLKNLMK